MNSKIIAAIALSAIVGCATQPVKPSANEVELGQEIELLIEQKAAELRLQKTPISPNASLTGGRAFINTRTLPEALDKQTAEQVKLAVKSELEEKGYMMVSQRRSAHLVVDLGSGYRKLQPVEIGLRRPDSSRGSGSSAVTVREKKVVNGKVIYARRSQPAASKKPYLVVQVSANSYGKRPTRLSYMSLWSPESEWTGYQRALLSKLKKEMSNMLLMAPTKEVAMDGEPGCTPRFGYYQKNQIVTEILNGSPAEKAGLRVGDEILAIDSEPGREQGRDEIYESMIAVPIKLKRKDQIVRSSIQSEIMCE